MALPRPTATFQLPQMTTDKLDQDTDDLRGARPQLQNGMVQQNILHSRVVLRLKEVTIEESLDLAATIGKAKNEGFNEY